VQTTCRAPALAPIVQWSRSRARPPAQAREGARLNKATFAKEGIMPRKYGRKASEKVEKAMHERKRGTLRSGSGGKVKSRKQAIAIGLNQARRAGGKVPKRSGSKSSRSRRSRSR
jgi:hypothetical protein